MRSKKDESGRSEQKDDERNSKKEQQTPEPSLPAGRPQKDSENTDDEDDTTDFGGLPERDLKKNLGCG